MKNILCFGDSNTWGYSPVDGTRYPLDVRWTGVLQKSLGADYHVIEEGLNGRTTFAEESDFIDTSDRTFRSGSTILPMLIESHRPLGLVIILLGTNDLKIEFNLTSVEIAQGAKRLCEMVMNSEYLEDYPPQILLISPTHIGPSDSIVGAREKSLQFAEHYEKAATELGVHFLDAANIVEPSELDGSHWDADQHIKFGELLSDLIPKII